MSDDFELDTLGFDDWLADGEPEIDVVEIETGPVEDKFWVSIRGPLEQQAEVLQRLAEAMKKLPGVEVGIGTVNKDGA